MRRGLMGRTEEELPNAVLDARLARLQAKMAGEGLDAFLIYSNLLRPSAVCWLTGFTPYWIDSILLVPRDGAPMLATALSKRVADWIRTTAVIGDIINTPKPGTAVGQRLVAGGCKRVGVLEWDAFPAGHYHDLAGAAPSVELSDATASFAAVRRHIDVAERNLIARADAIVCAALDQVDAAPAQDAGALAGLVEKLARLQAAEEAYIAVAPDLAADRRMIRPPLGVTLGDVFALRGSVAYKGSWVRRTRTFAKEAPARAVIARGDAWLAQAGRMIVPGRPYAEQMTTLVARLPGATLKGWMAEGSIGSYPLEAVASARMPGVAGTQALAVGTFLVLTVELVVDGMPWVGAAPVIVGGAATAD